MGGLDEVGRAVSGRRDGGVLLHVMTYQYVVSKKGNFTRVPKETAGGISQRNSI